MRIYNYLMGRFFEARAIRALNLHRRFKAASEKFFQRLDREDRK